LQPEVRGNGSAELKRTLLLRYSLAKEYRVTRNSWGFLAGEYGIIAIRGTSSYTGKGDEGMG
jgi:hypothetical protein